MQSFIRKLLFFRKKEDWPEELKYVDKLSDGDEVFFGLNLFAHERAEIDYSTLCLETVDLWLDKIESSEKYSKKQNIAITSVVKGRRLLRSAQLQIFKGYLPESEILFRSIFELKLVLFYILGDPTDDRANKYTTFSKKGPWDFRMLCEDLLGAGSYSVYEKLSQYPHPYNLGRSSLICGGRLQTSAIHDYDRAGQQLVLFGNAAVGLCELSNELFDNDPKWDKKHQEIYNTEIFKKNYQKNVQTKIDQEDKSTLRFFSKLKDIENNYRK